LGFGIWVLGFLSGCGSPPPLENTHTSPTALAEALLDAVAQRDRATLERVALTEREFRDHVWPQLPAARPERNLPFSYVWGDLRQKSTATLSRVLADHGGRRYQLLGVEFEGEADYRTYRVHRDARVRVRDAAGRDLTLRVCGSMLEQDGRWKVFSYVID
jgi:hypothetical protein